MRGFQRDPRRVAMVMAVLSAATLPAPLDAQDLLGRSRIEVRLGMGVRANAGATLSGSGIETETRAAGLLGSVGYAHWVNEGLALTGSAGFLAAEAKTSAGTSGFESRSASVFLFYFGARYYFPESSFGSQWRPFASAELGPVVGSQSWLELGRATTGESITAAAFGARFGGGLDIQLGHRVLLGASAGYDLMTDFSKAIGGRENHSGPDIGISIGLLFGGSGDRTEEQHTRIRNRQRRIR